MHTPATTTDRMTVSSERIDQRIRFRYEYAGGKRTFSHVLTIPPGMQPRDASLAKIALFARPEDCDSYELHGTQLDEETQSFLRTTLQAEVEARIAGGTRRDTGPVKTIGSNAVLCFSGGFDSLAARQMVGDRVRLMSTDFGGAFRREAESFRRFDTTVFKWELRGKRAGQTVRFNEKRDWRFLFAPALCYEDARSLTILAGTVLEASPFWFSGRTRDDFDRYPVDSFGPGTAMASPVSMLSEYGTTLLIGRSYDRETVERSLESLAGPKSFKRYRKMVLLAIVRGEALPPCPLTITKYSFGRQFGEDIVVLYLVWRLGPEWVERNYCENVPEDARFDMSFFEKIHRENLKTIDPEFAARIVRRMTDYGMSLTSDAELGEIERVKDFITSPANSRGRAVPMQMAIGAGGAGAEIRGPGGVEPGTVGG